VCAQDACRAVDVHAGDGQRALDEIVRAGAVLATTGAAIAMLESRDDDRPARPRAADRPVPAHDDGRYYELRMEREAVFEFFVRRMPPDRGFLLTAGLAQAVAYLEDLQFEQREIDWLATTGRFNPAALDRLASLRFTGDVDAMPEGTVCFAQEPILRVTAPLPEAQLIESRLINVLNFQTMIATKALRCRLAAGSRNLADFGMRRSQGAEAALCTARACYIAGFDATATVEAGREFGIPLTGTMAHSFVLSHPSEARAFRDFARCNPHDVTLLIDTYDTLAAAHEVVELHRSGSSSTRGAPRQRRLGVLSRECATSSIAVAALIRILASGDLDEFRIDELVRAGAPIDGFGVGTLAVSADTPTSTASSAAGVRRGPAAQEIDGQGDVARPQAGVPHSWRQRPNRRRRDRSSR
jgi:nicotinate phosphoribosyltransferase